MNGYNWVTDALVIGSLFVLVIGCMGGIMFREYRKPKVQLRGASRV